MKAKWLMVCVLAGAGVLTQGGVAALQVMAQQDEGPILRPKKPATKPAGATLLVLCDLACNWKLDGVAQGHIDAGGSAKAKVELGQHVVFATTEDALDKVDKDIEIRGTGQIVLRAGLQPVRDARLKAEEQARDKADQEARDKAAVALKEKERLGVVNAAIPQQPTGFTGRIHGRMTNPTGAPQVGGTVSLSTDSGRTSMYTFSVSASGEYTGEAAPGTYTVVYRTAGMPPDKQADKFDNVKIIAGQDVLQDIDMSRQAFIDALPKDQKKQLEDLRKHDADAMRANEVIKNLNADLRVVTQDIKDADSAHATAVQALGSTASKAELDVKEAEIKTAKYTEIESLMLKDTAAKPDSSILWAQLGQAQVGLKKYDVAEATYKKTLDLETASKKPNIAIQGLANSGLGEIYARTGKVREANAAYDAAAKVNPTQAAFYLKNEAVIFFQMNNAEAQVAAANEAILADPNQPLLYYLKGSGLIQKATINAKTAKMILPPGCLEAYQKYLELAPSGPYAANVKSILKQVE